MEKTLYGFNSSQDVIKLQTKYALFKRVANIVFSTEIESGFDKRLMTEALNKLFERNDCLRITFVDKGKETFQYFEDSRTIGTIKEVKFDYEGDKVRFLHKFRKKGLNVYKGETLQAVFAMETNGNQSIYFKVSHFVADTYAIGVLVTDLFKIYDALKNRTEMPPMPGSFESVLQKDLPFKDNEELLAKDREYFKDYYEVRHPEHPMYCGFHGNGSDRWMKMKKKGMFAEKYLFIKCDTEGYKFTIPAAVGAKVKQWCMDNQYPLSAFYFTTCNIAASIVNDREKYLNPLMLLDCRGTKAERTCGGTKVQAMSVYTTVDYSKSFLDNIKDAYADQTELYKHTRLTYLEIEQIQHKLWNYPLVTQLEWGSFSFIPMDAPEGVKFQVHSNGKGALVAYMALMVSPRTDAIDVVYDIQTKMITGPQIADFQNLYVHVIEAVIAASDKPMNEIL